MKEVILVIRDSKSTQYEFLFENAATVDFVYQDFCNLFAAKVEGGPFMPVFYLCDDDAYKLRLNDRIYPELVMKKLHETYPARFMIRSNFKIRVMSELATPGAKEVKDEPHRYGYIKRKDEIYGEAQKKQAQEQGKEEGPCKTDSEEGSRRHLYNYGD